MPTQHSRFSAEETARRGDTMYEQKVRSLVEQGSKGKVVAVDIETGEYALAEDALAASDLLLALRPDAEIWCVRVGSRTLHRMGRRIPALPPRRAAA